MIYEFIEILEHDFKSIIHFFRAMFCRHYRQGGCAIQVNNCKYWLCPKRKGVKK